MAAYLPLSPLRLRRVPECHALRPVLLYDPGMMTESLHSISEVAITAGVFTAMMAAGTSVPIGAVLNDLKQRRLVVMALLGNLVLVPLFAILLTRILPVTEPAQNALILLGVCAGVPMMTRLTILSHGERPFSIGIMILLMICTVIYAPLVVPLILRPVSVTSRDIASSLSVVMLLPLVGGLVARGRYPQLAHISENLAHIARPCMAIGMTAGIVAAWRDLVGTLGSWMLISALLLGLGGLAIGWLLARGAPPGDRQVAALGTGMRNFSAALLIAGRDFDAETLVMTSAGALMLMAVMLLVAAEIGRATPPPATSAST